MTIQPIVENAILHGIEPTGTYGEIRIGARLEASVLEEALERAKKERSQRARLTVADSEEFFQKKKAGGSGKPGSAGDDPSEAKGR